jgi:hypothetical protein
LEIGIYLAFGYWYLEFEIEAALGLEAGWGQTECQKWDRTFISDWSIIRFMIRGEKS